MTPINTAELATAPAINQVSGRNCSSSSMAITAVELFVLPVEDEDEEELELELLLPPEGAV
jgi:hypothetical protein